MYDVSFKCHGKICNDNFKTQGVNKNTWLNNDCSSAKGGFLECKRLHKANQTEENKLNLFYIVEVTMLK